MLFEWRERFWPRPILFCTCSISENVEKTGFKKIILKLYFHDLFLCFWGGSFWPNFQFWPKNFFGSNIAEGAKFVGLVWPWVPVIRIVRRSIPLYDPHFLWFEWREGIWPAMTLFHMVRIAPRSFDLYDHRFLRIRIERRVPDLHDPNFFWFELCEGQCPCMTLISCGSNSAKEFDLEWPLFHVIRIREGLWTWKTQSYYGPNGA